MGCDAGGGVVRLTEAISVGGGLEERVGGAGLERSGAVATGRGWVSVGGGGRFTLLTASVLVGGAGKGGVGVAGLGTGRCTI